MTATGAEHAFRGPPLHLLVLALRERLTGTVAVETMTGEEHLVYFQDGAPAKVLLAQPLLALDSIIVRMGAVDAADLVESVRIAYEHGMLLGRILVSRALISERQLEDALRWQVQEKVAHLLELSDRTRYHVRRGVNALDGYGGAEITPVDPICMLMHAARLDACAPVVDRHVAELRGLSLAVSPGAPLERLRAHGDEERALALLASGEQTFATLVAAGLAERSVKSVLFTLSCAELLEDVGDDGEEDDNPEWAHSTDKLSVLPQASMPTVSEPPWAGHGVVHSVHAPASSWPPEHAVPPSPQRAPEPSSQHTPGPSSQRAPAPSSQRAPAPSSQRAPAPSSQRAPISHVAAPTSSSWPSSHDSFHAPPRPEVTQYRRDEGRRDPQRQDAGGGEWGSARSSQPGDSGPPSSRRDPRELGAPRSSQPDEAPPSSRRGGAFEQRASRPTEMVSSPAYARSSPPEPTRSEPAAERVGFADSLRRRFLGDREAPSQSPSEEGREGAHTWCMADFHGCSAAEAFETAEEGLRLNDFDRAYAAASHAASLEPRNTTYRATQAYASGRRKGAPTPGREASHFAHELAVLTDIIVREPNFELPVYYRARLYKLARDFKRAIEDFEMCTLLNPSNVDAARELREYQAAKEKRRQRRDEARPSAPESKRGFFDWLSTGEWKKSKR